MVRIFFETFSSNNEEESLDSKLTVQVEELTKQLNNVEQQLINERAVKVQEFKTLVIKNLEEAYNIEDSAEAPLEEANDLELVSSQFSAENIVKLYECLLEEWQKAEGFSSFQEKLSKVCKVLQNISQTDSNSLRPVLESVSSLLKRINSQENSQFTSDFSSVPNSTAEAKLLAILNGSEASSAVDHD